MEVALCKRNEASVMGETMGRFKAPRIMHSHRPCPGCDEVDAEMERLRKLLEEALSKPEQQP